MNEMERDALQGHIRALETWLRNGEVGKPSNGMLDTLQAVVDVMVEEETRVRLSYRQACAVLLYHIKNPTAWLFRDPMTLKVIKTGLLLLQRKHERHGL